MCDHCGCDARDGFRIHSPSEAKGPRLTDGHEPAPEHDHPHLPDHDHDHGHGHSPPAGPRRVDVTIPLLECNDRQAERNRGFFRGRGILAVNLLSAPGSGKTTFICRTLTDLRERFRFGVIVGDLATENDALRIRECGVPAVQITTGTACHLDAAMIARALEQTDLDGVQILLIENVGNLVCPALFDLGEDLRLALLSVPEGEDKPLKYPPLFHSVQAVALTKTDLATATGFDRTAAQAHLRTVAPTAAVFELSARSGAGMDQWYEFLGTQRRRLFP